MAEYLLKKDCDIETIDDAQVPPAVMATKDRPDEIAMYMARGVDRLKKQVR